MGWVSFHQKSGSVFFKNNNKYSTKSLTLKDTNDFDNLNTLVVGSDIERYKKVKNRLESLTASLFGEEYMINYLNKEIENNKFYNIFFKSYYLYLYNDNVKLEKILNIYLDKIKQDNYKYLTNYNYKFETELILFDMMVYKYDNKIEEKVKKRLNLFINNKLKDKDSFSNKADDNHYYTLTYNYFKNNDLLIKEFETIYNKYLSNKSDEIIQAKLIEYSTYLSYFALKNKKHKDVEKYKKIIDNITIQKFSKASNYLEWDLSNKILLDSKKHIISSEKAEKVRAIKEKQDYINSHKIEFKIKKLIILIYDNLSSIYIFISIVFISYLVTLIMFKSLILKDLKYCGIIENLLKIRFKFIGSFIEYEIIRRLKKRLFMKLSKNSIKKDLISKVTIDENIYKTLEESHHYKLEFISKDDIYSTIYTISKELDLLPIILYKDIDLRIGCLDDILFKIDFSKYLFILDTDKIKDKNELLHISDTLLHKYDDSKIITIQQIKGDKI